MGGDSVVGGCVGQELTPKMTRDLRKAPSYTKHCRSISLQRKGRKRADGEGRGRGKAYAMGLECGFLEIQI